MAIYYRVEYFRVERVAGTYCLWAIRQLGCVVIECIPHISLRCTILASWRVWSNTVRCRERSRFLGVWVGGAMGLHRRSGAFCFCAHAMRCVSALSRDVKHAPAWVLRGMYSSIPTFLVTE